jgi:hypothetical protein
MSFRLLGTVLIILFTILSSILSTSVDMSGYELGAMFNLVIPPMAGIGSLILFLVISWISKNKTVWIITLIILCWYNLSVGIAFHTEQYESWPLFL